MLFPCQGQQRLGEDVREHCLCRAVLDRDSTVLHCLSDKMVTDVDVYGSLLIAVVFFQEYRPLVAWYKTVYFWLIILSLNKKS